MFILTVASTKGGVGKTTIAANLGGLLADIGMRVLLIDADVQPSLTRYFNLSHIADEGLNRLVKGGLITDECISRVELPPPPSETGDYSKRTMPAGCLHLVKSDAAGSDLQDWLSARLDRIYRIRIAICNPVADEKYDIVIIDTQGAIGHLQDAAINASDMLVCPASPDIISAREFVDGTLTLIERHECTAVMGLQVPHIKAVINRTENTNVSRNMTEHIREQFLTMRGRVSVLETTLPSVVAYKKAAQAQVPVHWTDPQKSGKTMHRLMWELIPALRGRCAPGFEK
ncbi:MAG: ParA family protein [Actinomycetaceae bacterium]|nr:ParA family protein [Actinomycetaceae bacterium]